MVRFQFTYAGYQYDKETGLYYCNSRMYDPVTARFLQEDTYGGDPNDPLSLNRYTYSVNNPLRYYDPTGHWPDFSGFFSEMITWASSLYDNTDSLLTAASNTVSSWGTAASNRVNDFYNTNSYWINPVATAAVAVGTVAVGVALLPEEVAVGAVAVTAWGVGELASTIGAGEVASTIAGNGLIGAGINLGFTEASDFLDNGKFDTSFNHYAGAYAGGFAFGALAPLGGELSPLANSTWNGLSAMSGNVVEQYVSTGYVDYTKAALIGSGGTLLHYGLNAGAPLLGKAIGDFTPGSLLSKSSFNFEQGLSSFASDSFSNYGNDIFSSVKNDSFSIASVDNSWKMFQESQSMSTKAIQDSINEIEAIQDSVAKIGGMGNPYDLLKQYNIPTTLSNEEIAVSNAFDFRMEYQGAGNAKYQVGAYQDIKGIEGLDAHHVGQKLLMKDFVKNYDINTAPAINVPKVGHTISGPNGVVSRSIEGINNARQLLARDIRELRRVYDDIPNSALKELIELNKEMYPEMRE